MVTDSPEETVRVILEAYRERVATGETAVGVAARRNQPAAGGGAAKVPSRRDI